MKALANLSSLSTFDCIPWDFRWMADPKTRAARQNNKKARQEWIRRSDTVHQCWCPWEGVNGTVRIAKPNKADEGNPAWLLHALAADFDSVIDLEELTKALENRCPFGPPNEVEWTMTPGHCRLVWVLDQPLMFASHEFAVHCLKHIATQMKFAGVLSGFDAGAFEDPSRYYTNNGEWRHVTDAPLLSAALIRGWMQESSEKFNWAPLGLAIPLEHVAPELAKLFPRFSEWPGDFKLGSQGPSFWVNGSVSPTSAIVRETGIQTFAAHAHKAFFSWSELLGAAFTETFRVKQLGAATENVYWDTEKYWRLDGEQKWMGVSQFDISMFLRTNRGLSAVRDKTGHSQLDSALLFIQDYQNLAQVTERVFQPYGLLVEEGRRILNVSQKRVVQPVNHPVTWGPQGEFTFISMVLDALFVDAEQEEYFKAWLARFYQGAYRLNLESGQALIFAGGGGIGKTMLNVGIVGGVMGGSEDAGRYLAGKDQYGGELWQVGHWAVDDFSAFDDHAAKQAFAEGLKAVVANTMFSSRQKYQVTRRVPWCGRVLITCNLDSLSSDMIPSLDRSNADKIVLLRGVEDPPVQYASQSETTARIKRELPFFARYLLDYKTPERLIGASRFGIQAFKDKLLAEVAQDGSFGSTFADIFMSALRSYFETCPKEEAWQGSSVSAFRLIDADGGTKAMRLSAISTGRYLSSLMQRPENPFHISRQRLQHVHTWWSVPREAVLEYFEKVKA